MILAQQLNFEQFTPFAVFGLFAAVAWWVMGLVASGKPRTLERLDELKNPRARRDPNSAALKKADTMAKMLERATPALAKPLAPKDEQEQGKLKLKLACAGFRGEAAVSTFLGLKFAGLLLGLFLGGGTIVGLSGVNNKTLAAAVGLGGLFFYLPSIVVWFIRQLRHNLDVSDHISFVHNKHRPA